MTLGPEDVVRKTFNSTRFRGGYVVEEVDGFLEEIVAALRRFTTKVDEQQAAINTLKAGGGTTAHDLEVESTQLEQVRLERDAIVAELADADSRVAAAREAAILAEESRNASLAELRARFDDDLLAMEQKVAHARGDADAAERDSAQRIAQAEGQAAAAEQQTTLVRERLAAMCAEVRSAAYEHLGSNVVDELVPLAACEDDPVAQASALAMLAERIRQDHIAAGQAEAQRIRGEAALERDALAAEGRDAVEAARNQAAGLLTIARTEGEQTKGVARYAADKLLAEAQRQHDEKLQAAESRGARMIEDARLERDAVVADLRMRREALQAKVSELEGSQKEYRQRLRTLISEQLAEVDADGWDPILEAESQPLRTS